jgi:hypothetical protein
VLDVSDGAHAFLPGQPVEVAKALHNVGVHKAGRLAENNFQHEEGPRVLH